MTSGKTYLQYTKDYDVFEMHPCNRPRKDKPKLKRSMREHGFMPSNAIHVKQHGDKLQIVRGHHRFMYARELNLPVYFIIDNTQTDIFPLEGDSSGRWSASDFAYARAQDGNKDIATMLAFARDHRLPFGATASLMGGESAGSNNKLNAVREGTFKVKGVNHAKAVVAITDLCREKGVEFATHRAFVNAVSMVLRIPELNAEQLARRIRSRPSAMHRRSRVEDYLDEIESAYNYHSTDSRLPVTFRAMEEARKRQHLPPGGKRI